MEINGGKWVIRGPILIVLNIYKPCPYHIISILSIYAQDFLYILLNPFINMCKYMGIILIYFRGILIYS